MCCRSLLSPGTELAFRATSSPPIQPFVPPTAQRQPAVPEPERSSAVAYAAEDLLELSKLSIYWVLLEFC
jgi:hypothetical protein